MEKFRPFVRATLNWIPPLPLDPKAGPPFAGLQDIDFDLLKLIAEARYLLIRQAINGLDSYRLASHRLRQLERYGWLQRARLPQTAGTGSGPRYCYSLTSQGLDWLRELFPDWAESHETLEALAGKVILRQKVWHEILRTDAAQALVKAAQARGWDAVWSHGSQGFVRAYPYGPQAHRLTIVPDAVLEIAGHRWLLELERSWRTTTAAEKSLHYTLYFEHELWAQKYWTEPPRILFVLTEESTQHASLDQWMEKMTILRTPQAKVLLLSQVDRTPIQVARVDPRDAMRIEQESWLDLNAPTTVSGSMKGVR